MEFIPSPNFWKGRNGYTPIAIVIHQTEGAFAGAVSWLTNKTSQVSAHYVIAKDGTVVQLVADENTAWHAGRIYNPTWKLPIENVNPNYYTIGIEHEILGSEAMTIEQFEASTRLIAALAKKFNIPLDNKHIIKHKSIYAKKTCGTNLCIGF